MVFEILILVCSLATPHGDCDLTNAERSVQSAVTIYDNRDCLAEAALLAEANAMKPGEGGYLKLGCRPLPGQRGA